MWREIRISFARRHHGDAPRPMEAGMALGTQSNEIAIYVRSLVASKQQMMYV